MKKLLIILVLLSTYAEAQLPKAYRKWKLGGVATTAPPASTTTTPPSVTYNTANMVYGRIPVTGDMIFNHDYSSGNTEKFVNGIVDEEFVIGATSEGIIPNSTITVAFPKSYSVVLDSVLYGDRNGNNSTMQAWTLNAVDPRIKETAFAFTGPDRLVYQKHKFSTPRRTDYYEFQRTYPNPTELVFVGWYYPQTFPAYTVAGNIPIQNHLGFVTYQWNYQFASAGGLDSTRLQIMRAGNIYRTYVDLDLIAQKDALGKIYTGYYAFQPAATGGWKLDDVTKWAKDNGKLHIICPKNGEGTPKYAQALGQMALRYGPNNTFSPTKSKVFQGPGYPANSPVVGLNTLHYYQLGNEPNRWWKGRIGLGSIWTPEGHTTRYDSVARGLLPDSLITNQIGMMTPFELAFTAKVTADSIRKYDPSAHIIMAGLASSNPQYLRGILQWCDIYNNGEVFFDGFAYHDYNNTAGGQNGANPPHPGVAPENAPYGQHIARMKQALKDAIPGKDVTLWITETGYSIQDINPPSTGNAENVAKTIKDGSGNVLRDRFQTQGDWNLRSSLVGMRLGLNGTTWYQLYDNNEVKFNPTTYQPWDAGMGVAFEPTSGQAYAYRPATAFAAQLVSFARDYTFTSSVTDQATGVIIDRLDKAGSPTLYAVTKPTEAGSTASVTLSLPGVSSVIRYALNDTGAVPTSATLSVSGGNLTVTATETPTFYKTN